jgi:hypothetical protein
MNPCIQQLAEQAAEQAIFDDLDLCMITEADSGQLLQVPAAFVQRFAELIVEECCNRLGEETILHDGYGYNQHELYNRLRKHFGVEE